MTRRVAYCLFAIAAWFLTTGCATHAAPTLAPIVPPAPLFTPAPVLIINSTLQDDAEICVPRAVFARMGLTCMTVGELRALLRSRRDVAAHEGDR